MCDGGGGVHQGIGGDVPIPVDGDDFVRGDALFAGDFGGELNFKRVALTIVEGHGVDMFGAAFCNGFHEAGGAVLATREDNENGVHLTHPCVRR